MTPLRPGVSGDVANIHDFHGPSEPSDVTVQRVKIFTWLPILKKNICLRGIDILISGTSSVHRGLNTTGFDLSFEALPPLLRYGVFTDFRSCLLLELFPAAWVKEPREATRAPLRLTSHCAPVIP